MLIVIKPSYFGSKKNVQGLPLLFESLAAQVNEFISDFSVNFQKNVEKELC